MGVMPIIAPYVKRAEEEVSKFKERQEDLEKSIKELQCPRIFVEGLSDYIVFHSIQKKVFANTLEKICLVKPPANGAGTNYVADSLVGWNLAHKNLPIEGRLRAFGILDSDDAGKQAKKKIAEHANNKLVNGGMLPIPRRYIRARQSGVIIPITLEETYPLDLWNQANENNWLERRSPSDVLTRANQDKIFSGDVGFEDLIDDLECKLVALWKVRPERKEKWADLVSNLTTEQLKESVPELINIFRSAVEYCTNG